MDYNKIDDVINGCLLGDGSIIKHKNGKNCYFSYCSSNKSHIEFVHQYFKFFCTEINQNIRCLNIFDKRTLKYYIQYSFVTKSLPFFTEYYKKWYKNGIKIIPEDLKLTSISVLFWYVGDGELEKKYGYIKLHTNCFSYSESSRLVKLLDFSSKVVKKENKFIITIPRVMVNDFLNFIGNPNIIGYEHKWRQVAYKNKNIEKNGFKFYDNILPIILEDYLKNFNTIYFLSKKYVVPIKSIKNYFIKNNINFSRVETKKSILQFYENGDFIKEWVSGVEIKKTLNYSPSAISDCCRGLRKKYKNYIWKFKK